MFNNLDNNTEIPSNVNILLSLTGFNAPKSFYIVNDTNNVLDINGTEYTITEGNYNAYTILDSLNALNPDFSFSYSRITAKINVSSTSTSAFYISGSILSILGFSETTSTTNGTLTSDQIVDFNGINSLLIDIPNFSINNQNSWSGDTRNVIVIVPVDNSNYINYLNPQSIRYVMQDIDLSSLIIKLTDTAGNFLDFHNHDWTLCINIEYQKRTTKNESDFVNLSQFYKLVNENKISVPIKRWRNSQEKLLEKDFVLAEKLQLGQ